MRLPGFLTRNVQLKALAALLAVLTWTAVVYAQNPPEERDFNVHVPQDATSLPQHFVLLHSIPDLSITVAGTRDHLDSFDTATISVSVAWHAVTHAGTVKIPIAVRCSDNDVDLVGAPTSVTADVDVLGTVTSRESAVVPTLTGSVGLGHELAGITVQPVAVLVSGPTTVLQTLDSLTTDAVPLTGLTQDRDFVVHVVTPPGVTATPQTVLVVVTVTTLTTPGATPSPPGPSP